MRTLTSIRIPRHVQWIIVATVVLGLSGSALAQVSNWTNTGGGDYFTGGNWSNGVPNAAGSTGNFNTLNIASDVEVFVDSSITVGNLIFGDTDLGSAGTWALTTNALETAIITLDNNGATPTITVNELTPTTFDDVFIGNSINSTAGLTKAGNGILSLNNPNDIMGTSINIDGGHLRYNADATPTTFIPYNMADGTTLTTPFFIPEVSVASGASVTINQTATGNQFLQAIHGQGTGESLVMNLDGPTGRVYSLDMDWAGFENVTFNGTGGTPLDLRARVNPGGSDPPVWNAASFTNTNVTLNNARFFVRTNSQGNNVVFGSLSGDATAALGGGNAGSAVRYQIGGLNGDSEFAGNLDGIGGMTLQKMGTGTLTLSGANTGVWTIPNTPGRTGGVVQVAQGTLALTNTMDSIAGGAGINLSTIDVQAGATLDVSGTTNTFSTAALQQVLGTGTIRGDYNHDEGTIRPGDTTQAAAANEGPTNVAVPTAGSTTFDGGVLTFNGGSIIYDLNPTPGTDDLLMVTNGSVNHGTGGIVEPNFLAATPAAGLTYTFLNSTGGFNGNINNWSVAWPGRGTKPAVFADGNDLKFTTTPIVGGGDIVWTGTSGANWDVETSQNWSLGGSPDVYFQGDSVRFDDTGSNVAITIAAPVEPADVVVDSSTNNYSFTGSPINGATSLTKRGTSTLTLGMTSGYTGATNVEGGTVDIGEVGGALGNGQLNLASATLMSAGGGLTNSGIDVAAGTSNTIQVDGAAGSGGTFGIATLTGDGELTVTSTVDDKWFAPGVTSGFTGILNVGPAAPAALLGNFRIRGGQTTFPDAVVNLSAVTVANQQGSSAAEVTFAFGELHGDAATTLSGFVGGSAAPDANWEIGNLNTDSEFAGVIADGAGGSGGSDPAISHVTKVGDGTLTLSGANTYTGDTTIEGGTLSIGTAFLADTANVFIDTDAVLNLDFAGTDSVNFLYFGNNPLAQGIYGAANSSGRITGTGMLNVLFEGPTLGLTGDYNDDGVVNAADYIVWRNNEGTANALPNDPLGGNIGAAHYDQWVANFGNGLGGGAATGTSAVPEPSSLMLLIAVFVGMAATCRRHAQRILR